MRIRVGINGFGHIGRIALRVAWHSEIIQVVHINEIAGDAVGAAHLAKYDSIHGTWDKEILADADGAAILIDGVAIGYSQCDSVENPAWAAAKVDLVKIALANLNPKSL